MATTKLVSPPCPKPLTWASVPSKEGRSRSLQLQPWPCVRWKQGKRVGMAALNVIMEERVLGYAAEWWHQNPSSLLIMAAESGGYSLASYYTSLGLFVISVPGLWSLIKRSVKSKIVRKTLVEKGEGRREGKQVAGEILSFFTRNNFNVIDRGDAITFEGRMVPSRGQAALLTFCTCISLGSVALVLTITLPQVGNNWFWITLLSPLAGVYYWRKASRKEQIKVKMMVGEDGRVSEIVVQGDDQQVEQMRKELKLSEKGMVYVKGLFER